LKNLVIGFATNQPELSLRVFCLSLRSVYGADECDLIIVTNRFEPYFEELARNDVDFEATPNNYSKSTSKLTKAANRLALHSLRLQRAAGLERFLPEVLAAYPTLLETWHHPQLARWFAYRRILDVKRYYRQIFFADVKDVVFQAPFFDATSKQIVSLFADDALYGNCYWNDKWLREAYGEDALKQAVGRQPVCIGTVLASSDPALSLLNEFTAQMEKAPFGRIEQAIFNQMLLSHSLQTPTEIRPNVTDIVATMGANAQQLLAIKNDRICRTNDGSIVPVVHMYDRRPDTRALIQGRFGNT
jgi:hypothetical protein